MQSIDAIRSAVAMLQIAEQELLLFAAFWFLVGALDDFCVDLVWLWLKLAGRTGERRLTDGEAAAPLQGRAAILIAAWNEPAVIGHTMRHALSVWRQEAFTLYVGCYFNDPPTLAAAVAAAGSDPRVRIVIHGKRGPTTKADCLNRLYKALCDDEERHGFQFRSVILHDSEDMVHPAELVAIDAALGDCQFVQLPVRPEPQPKSPWVGGHYIEEFTEQHAKVLVVRNALGAAIPAAGVACGFARDTIARIAEHRLAAGGVGPFAAECLTEDYELGLLVGRSGGRSRFLRMRDAQGQLVATRAYFPSEVGKSVRQKARWIHGIAFQGWDRLGWCSTMADLWMVLRDRRGPLTAIVLCCGYALVVIEGVLGLLRLGGFQASDGIAASTRMMLVLCLVSLGWRCAVRFAFTAHEYGVIEGLRALLRIPIANFIAILAGRDAMVAYVRTLRGGEVKWEKTAHDAHPAAAGAVRPS